MIVFTCHRINRIVEIENSFDRSNSQSVKVFGMIICKNQNIKWVLTEIDKSVNLNTISINIKYLLISNFGK